MSRDEHLDERALLLDDEDLLEPAGEGPHDGRLEGIDHPEAQQAYAVLAQVVLREAEVGQRLQHLVVGAPGGHDAEPRWAGGARSG